MQLAADSNMLEVGRYRPQRQRRRLNLGESLIVSAFHRLYYNSWNKKRGPSPDIKNLHWFGVHMMKCPLDLWTYQELITEHRPDLIIETGTHAGGSALYMASICELLGKGSVLTIDIEDRPGRPEHHRVEYLLGSSTAPEILEQVKARVAGKENVMVILDSDHRCDHVLRELELYHDFVPKGGFLIVEDTNVNGHPAKFRWGKGPYEAVQSFLQDNQDFVIDKSCERFLMTLNPNGFLRRVR